MSTAKAAPRKLKVGDKVVFMLHDYTYHQRSIPRNRWIKGTIDYFFEDGSFAIAFYHNLGHITMLEYVNTNSSLLGRMTVIRKVA